MSKVQVAFGLKDTVRPIVLVLVLLETEACPLISCATILDILLSYKLVYISRESSTFINVTERHMRNLCYLKAIN